MRPRLISGWPKTALSPARIMSHIIANSQPPPKAYPLTAAIIWDEKKQEDTRRHHTDAEV